ncbi:hypothetical protein SPOG_02909 [Schizosaccharomyces cryophilus OY26]|uniref:Uncharacterized protein n=1 Tax=Schizosaccharomyces cryophilus (strain OY26 / ATCC MYA-4695 / CBS 11777 / NBRC 106824 / NRRL Y48691) TaxID=653667 RepID=S9W1J2_SCHCR|nr:uncharacterized protein SPOG_02909 [Schizosaccharomyces cryophilus OY26]EPY53863.1 hypothetical protein SPOG_02909 [Schizosaccharomyces cryophilus OY26]
MSFGIQLENDFKSMNSLFESVFSPFLAVPSFKPVNPRTSRLKDSFIVPISPFPSSLNSTCFSSKVNEGSLPLSKLKLKLTEPLNTLWLALWKAQVSAKDSCLFRSLLLKDLSFSQILNEIIVSNQDRNIFMDSHQPTYIVRKLKNNTLENTQLKELQGLSNPINTKKDLSNNSATKTIARVKQNLPIPKPAKLSLETQLETSAITNPLNYASLSYQIPWIADCFSLTQQPLHVSNLNASDIISTKEKNYSIIYPKRWSCGNSSQTSFISNGSYYIGLALTILLYLQFTTYSLKDYGIIFPVLFKLSHPEQSIKELLF